MIANAKRDTAVAYLENEQLKAAKKQRYYPQRIIEQASIETPLAGEGPHPLAGAGGPHARMSDEQAHATFRALRWHETGGDPVCPHCGCCAAYEFRTRRLFKCKGCGKQFSVTSGTTFHGRKLAIRDYLMAIAIFANAAKGISALQLGRDLDVSYKTAFVLAHKLREAMAADQAKYQPKGHVEVDGAYFGGTIRQENHKADRKDRRLAQHETGKRRVVVVMRERQGRSLPFVVKAEDEGVTTVARRVQPVERGGVGWAEADASVARSIHERLY